MASLTPVNGSSASGLSPAEQLKARHAANTPGDHHVLLEDVIDEDDIQHPPPAAGPSKVGQSSGTSDPITTAGASDTGRGKAKAAPLNVNSEEAFPSLGPSKAAAAPLQTWSKRPVVSANGSASAANGASAASKGKAPSQQNAPAASRPAISSVSLPGRSVERISFAPHQITPRNQLKRTVPEILREINRKYKAKVEVREGTDGHVVFEGTGTQEAVRQALKEVANQLGSKQSIKIPVPLSVRSHLIGRQGATIQGISKRSGAKINIPKHDSTPGEDEDDATIDITVEGDAVAAELARQDIQKIINERTSNVSMRLKEIPPEFYPFLAGPRQSNIPHLVNGSDVNITIPHYHTWEHAPPAQAPSRGRPAPFVAQQNLPIRISGDRLAAQEAREKIERQTEILRRQLTSYEVPIERGRHQFIVGPDGDMLHDFVAETGCSIVMPPNHDESEILYIIGPDAKIEDAVNKVMDIAASMSVGNVDVARQHARAPPSHAHQISRYLQERRAIAALERQFGANVILPPSANSPATWQIFSRDGKQCMKARAEAMNLIAGHPPSRFHSLQVNPFFHPHLQSQANQIRRDQGVHLLFPPTEDPDSHELVLIYEQPGAPSEYEFPRQAPSPAQVQEIQKTIQQVVAQLLGEIGNPNDVVSQKVEAPQKYHEKIQRYVDREQRKPSQSQIPPQLVFGRQGSQQPGFHVRGRQADVNELNSLIEAFLEQEKKDELERGFTTSFEFPHKYAGHLVGKKGDSIKKLQDEFDVEINYTEGKVELKGPQAKCAACKSHILSLAKKLDDEATHAIKIPAQYHGDLKGQKGNQVLRLQERYNVRINFPRAAQAPADDADAATEASFRNHPTQAPDVVIIKGPKKGADEAKEELLNLLQYAVDHSHSGTVLVSAKQIPSLIGSGGRELDALRVQTGAAIDMPKKDDSNEDGNGRVEVKIKGTKQQDRKSVV